MDLEKEAIGLTAPWNEVQPKMKQGSLGGAASIASFVDGGVAEEGVAPERITDACGMEVKWTEMERMSSERACNGLRKKNDRTFRAVERSSA